MSVAKSKPATDARRASRCSTANVVLASFFDGHIEDRKGGVYVCWSNEWDGDVAKRWQCRGQDFYPVWHHKYPGGGTSSTALSQLVRWIQGKPVLPISTWHYWSREQCKLLPEPAVRTLSEGGYPGHVNCVLCGKLIVGSLDWWHLDKVSGPCCSLTTGCRGKIR